MLVCCEADEIVACLFRVRSCIMIYEQNERCCMVHSVDTVASCGLMQVPRGTAPQVVAWFGNTCPTALWSHTSHIIVPADAHCGVLQNFAEHTSAVRSIQALHGTKVGDKLLHVSLQTPRLRATAMAGM